MAADVDSLAQQLVSGGPEQLVQVLGRVDQILSESAGVSLTDVLGAAGLADGAAVEEQMMAPEPSVMDAGVVDGGQVPWGSDAPAQTMPAGGRQRLTMR